LHPFITNNGHTPSRIVVLGAGGFVGRSLCRALSAYALPWLGISHGDIDLADDAAAERLAALLRTDDAVIILAAVMPRHARSWSAFAANIIIMKTVCAAIARQPVAHLTYLSSDAVYPSTALESATALDETTPPAPEGLYGLMHLSREAMLADAAGDTPLAIIRPVMLVGADDPHDAYGPNRFCRAALAGQPIALYGQGEDIRDYLDVADLTRLLCKVVLSGGRGILNAASGEPLTARQAAEACFSAAGIAPAITMLPRQQAACARRYNVQSLRRNFPDIAILPASAAIADLVKQARELPQ
jgi:UDP-glucose 4-epimerase